ncbi:MAG TPA: SulP family inorganic anion transporter [Mariprofundaceae bacterium]|nr:SulP family inorganic anion transporter [Mariprofundaceae bacterium]
MRNWSLQGLRMGDVWGGLSASSLVLPQAMAFGITLWSPYTHDPAAAAMSGLVAAACLCIASGLFRGTEGLVSAPTGPTLVLLAGAIAALSASGLTGDTLITATLLTVAMGGMFQVLIGGFHLGHLIKYIPYPVVSGFMTGTALLMIMSQTASVLGTEANLTMHQGAWIPMAVAGMTLASIIWLPRWINRIPGTVLGLIVGTLAFHVFSFAYTDALPASWVVGSLPNIGDLHVGFDLGHMGQFPWLLMAGSALALSVLASLDTLLTSVVADVSTGTRHHARKELMGQGAGHLLSSMFGGMAGAGTTGSTLVAIQSGGRQWAGLVTGISMLLLILFMGPVASVLPISVFAGIILHVAIFGMLDKDILRWLGTPQARIDAAIALIVTGVTVFYDLMVAVGLGVALAAVEFIRAQVQTAVIQLRWNIGERTSLRRRPKQEHQALIANPDAIVGYDLKGTLFFGTTDHLLDAMADDLKKAKYILLDMRRVTQVDLTAVRLIEHMYGILRERGGELILAHAPKTMGLVKREGHHHERLVPYHENVVLRTFPDSDRALEYAENCLLREISKKPAEQGHAVSLAESELMGMLNKDEKSVLAPYFEIRKIKSGEHVFRKGEHGEELFVLLDGEVEVLLPYGHRKKHLRLATFGPGMTVGEIAFLEPGPRTADGRVTRDGEIAVFHHKALKKLFKEHADIGMRLLLRLGHDISINLRIADAELRRRAS